MPGLSTYFENALLNWIKGTTFPSSPANLFVSLHTANPGATGASEVSTSGTAYARVAVASGGWSATGAGSSQSRQITNSGAITFPAPSGSNWGTVTHVGLSDAATAGNFVASGAISSGSGAVNAGDGAPAFAAGQLTVNVT